LNCADLSDKVISQLAGALKIQLKRGLSRFSFL